ncbi:hypothetical protein JZK55_23440 [Dissulfurispira thermophila]|uniref:PBS lyase HEAT domain protein repeat-containing protein n=1 Tax=Dissulfurispira thermophila TaxID=2715679 RepID=A0A7G1H5N2_9BACT|nr:DVU0298 family protein [Dissulfurispira thermophila]BCB97422.1 hypothetical protein JZK55_23440 [Dissulfurispira thermophila]
MNKYPPECPFCGRYVVRPETTKTEFGEILSGRCNCGAVYVCDPTGHNAGEAYMEALALARGNWEIELMGEDIDYQTKDMDYDLKTHMKIYSAGVSEMKRKLIFVKHGSQNTKDSNRLSADSSQENLLPVTRYSSSSLKRHLKERIKDALISQSYTEIADMARNDKGVIRHLISLAYEKDEVSAWRAIEAMGVVAGELSKEKMDVVRDTIRRLLWSMGEESGGIGWSAAEMLGEIIRSNPDEFADIIPIVWSFKEEEMFRPGVVWAMGRIASVRPDLVRFILKDMQHMITDKNPAVRGYAAWTIGILNENSFIEDINKLTSDKSLIHFYQNGDLAQKTVAEIAIDSVKSMIYKQNK